MKVSAIVLPGHCFLFLYLSIGRVMSSMIKNYFWLGLVFTQAYLKRETLFFFFEAIVVMQIQLLVSSLPLKLIAKRGTLDFLCQGLMAQWKCFLIRLTCVQALVLFLGHYIIYDILQSTSLIVFDNQRYCWWTELTPRLLHHFVVWGVFWKFCLIMANRIGRRLKWWIRICNKIWLTFSSRRSTVHKRS